MEKGKRGSYDYRFDRKMEVPVVKWHDNKVISVMINYNGVDPLTMAQRYDRKETSFSHNSSKHITKAWEKLTCMIGR